MLYSLKNEEKKYEKKEDLQKILKYLENNQETIKELDLSSNVFLPDAMAELCKYIKKIKNLKTIILDGIFTTLTKEEMLECFKLISLSITGKDIILLDLSNNALSSELPIEFINLLSNLNSLKFLNIRNCGLGKKGGDIIGECFVNLKTKDNLEYLDIAQNRFFVFPEKLILGINSLKNLNVLKLEYNTIEKITMTKALEILKNHPLEILDIRDNFLNIEGCKILGEIFATWNIRELYMGDCLCQNEGILEFIKNANKKFTSMNLPGDCKEDNDIVLDISYNDWEQDCVEELTDFCDKYNIKKLIITGNFYEDESQLNKVMREYGGELVSQEEENEEEKKGEVDETLISMLKNIH
ncbi:Ran GTPase-activating protein 1 (rna1) [Vairimorpha necatrix]|uniref:Ran GTPase-activating protein 1 (Rna1) n=1 Tax=Vairimorpha necatrix TaxID=6039 RepID=A0AAX4JC73_9MICR